VVVEYSELVKKARNSMSTELAMKYDALKQLPA